MREAKKNISTEYLERLNASPFFIVVDYKGLKVEQFSELRTRLDGAKAELHVVKNRIFNIAAKEAGFADDLATNMSGQLAVVTGESEISSAAKILKNFESEFEMPSIRFGYMGETRLDEGEVKFIADLPSMDVLRAQIVGVIQAPAQKLATLLNVPGSQLAQVIKAKAEKDEN
ncbi:MAG: 50S ribosomal protein L10 [Verrucomicrobiota bacterium]|jgi:large subunit ribosomal protein L10|nr:50S ribosomal protein L10 [Verrucomicrobiota bacterium]MDG1890520.1 50S ribosomal protein L10 [Verrucomicrobiota bacterium]